MVTGKIEELIRKGKCEGLSKEERDYLEFLLVDLGQRNPETLSERERALLASYDAYLLQTGKAVLSDEEAREMSQQVYAALAREQDFPNPQRTEESQEPDAFPLRPAIKRRILPAVAGAAAVVALLLALNFFVFPKPQTLYAGNAITQYYLPDSTFVILNKGSRLTLQRRFNQKTRTVEMSGEVFFDVARNLQKPFIIHHGELTTTVKGTSFTITDYPELDSKSVTVNTGRVSVKEGKTEIALLTPDQKLAFNKTTQRHQVMEVNACDYSAWIAGGMAFKKAEIGELAFRLKQQFGKELVIKDGVTIRYITATFRQGVTEQEIMETLADIYGIRFRISDKTIDVWQ